MDEFCEEKVYARKDSGKQNRLSMTRECLQKHQGMGQRGGPEENRASAMANSTKESFCGEEKKGWPYAKKKKKNQGRKGISNL